MDEPKNTPKDEGTEAADAPIRVPEWVSPVYLPREATPEAAMDAVLWNAVFHLMDHVQALGADRKRLLERVSLAEAKTKEARKLADEAAKERERMREWLDNVLQRESIALGEREAARIARDKAIDDLAALTKITRKGRRR